MSDNPINSMKGIFNRNQNVNSPKNRNVKRSKKVAGKQQRKNLKGKKQMRNPKQMQIGKIDPNQLQMAQNPNMPYQREMSELDAVYMKHVREIEKEISKLVADVQYLDSKSPVNSSETNKLLVELITNVWTIGNILSRYQEENQVDRVSQMLAKHEKRLLKILEDPKKDSPNITEELDEIRACQKIVKDSLRPINSATEYYNVLLSKLSNWGFEIKDPIGQKYDVHMDMDILAFEDADPNLEVPMITETKKPEIYLNGNKLAKAKVIVTKAGAKK